jgi:hypothetical protein
MKYFWVAKIVLNGASRVALIKVGDAKLWRSSESIHNLRTFLLTALVLIN